MLKQRRPRFPELLRLYIYSFVDTKTCITHISQLCKKEKKNLMNSYLVREGREHSIRMEDLESFGIQIKRKTLDLRYGVINTYHGVIIPKFDQLKNELLLSLIEKIYITWMYYEEEGGVPSESFAELIKIIKQLPQRFHDK